MEIETHQNFKIIYIVVGLVVLVGIGYFFFTSRNGSNPPYKVLTPSSYPKGSQIEVYKSLPNDFPTGIILENKEITNASVVTSPDKKTKITVSYVSDKTATELGSMYENNFKNKDWTIVTHSSSRNSVVFQAEKNNAKIILTIAPFLRQMMVTFQYEK
jgi:hypothetical protein